MSNGGAAADGNSQQPPNKAQWKFYIPLLGGLGIGAELLYVTQIPGHLRWGVFGTAVAVASASALVGGIVGLLFGIPLANQNRQQGAGDDAYKPNTNLEQVSDWLTKILVGVGLVQIGHALPALSKLARNLKTPLGGLSSSSAFGLGVVIYFALLGFLFLYLWARLVLPLELSGGLINVIQAQISKTDATRSTALKLVNQQLNSRKGGSPPTAAELNAAVAAAPDSTRLLIFNEAEQFRKNVAAQIRKDLDGTPRREQEVQPGDDAEVRARKASLKQNQQLVALTVPVFQALIAADTQKQYHRNHGSLGYALKDKAGPAATDSQTWQAAVSALDTAIDMRARLGVFGWGKYEANRAVANINLRQLLPDGDARIPALDAQIQQDLDAAQRDPQASPMVAADGFSVVDPGSGSTTDPDIREWRLLHPPPAH